MALNIDKPAKKITVGDYNSKKQIEADTAFWVIGGEKMGVMTTRAKWAFESKEPADEFMKQNGGRPATFEEVMKAAFEDMYEDGLINILMWSTFGNHDDDADSENETGPYFDIFNFPKNVGAGSLYYFRHKMACV